MRRKLLSLALAAVGVMAVSVGSAGSAERHRHDHGYRHVNLAHRASIRPGHASAPFAAWNWYGQCFTDEGQGRFRPCSRGGN